MHYKVVVKKTTSEKIFFAIQKYFDNHGDKRIKYHLGIDKSQLLNIYQQMDVGTYNSLNDMYLNFNKEVGTRSDITIGESKYKKVITLLLAYRNNIIEF